MKERIVELADEIIRIPQIRFAGGLVQTYLNAVVNEALEMAANTCEDQSVWADTYKCAAAIRKLKV